MSFSFFTCFSFLVLNFGLFGRVRLGFRLFLVSCVLPFYRLIMRVSFGPSHLGGLRIKEKTTEESELGRAGGGFGSPAFVVVGVLPVGYLSPLGKGNGKIKEIRYPYGSEYLRVAVRYADVMGPSHVKPSCDAPKPGGPLTTPQPSEYSWMSGNPTPLMKIRQSLLCTGSSTQGTKPVPTIYNDHTRSTCE